ncbi:hypothetical protein [Streptomyces sp. RerS4]|uniref:hypothetical protein n=1 Tax=Streptomyces sp. RerS4 TaxID=2942449 RepID=UPI00201BB3BE|nr:hypothetical protein [Streptomyces sp. RerS4]UQX04748.1 hypothetical protein M4D82_32740 [Streptomyces sp. RerS4]
MTNTKRVLAAVALTGAALAFSGIAHAQENEPTPSSSNEAPPQSDRTIDALADGFIENFEKKASDLLGRVGS